VRQRPLETRAGQAAGGALMLKEDVRRLASIGLSLYGSGPVSGVMPPVTNYYIPPLTQPTPSIVAGGLAAVALWQCAATYQRAHHAIPPFGNDACGQEPAGSVRDKSSLNPTK
jgi:hypothetical protein